MRLLLPPSIPTMLAEHWSRLGTFRPRMGTTDGGPVRPAGATAPKATSAAAISTVRSRIVLAPMRSVRSAPLPDLSQDAAALDRPAGRSSAVRRLRRRRPSLMGSCRYRRTHRRDSRSCPCTPGLAACTGPGRRHPRRSHSSESWRRPRRAPSRSRQSTLRAWRCTRATCPARVPKTDPRRCLPEPRGSERPCELGPGWHRDA